MSDESPPLESPPLSYATDYPNLLPPNSTKLERAIAGPTGRIDNAIPVPFDTLLQPYACPTAYLPWLAWHMSLDLWDWRWDEFKRREVIARAVELNRCKGTASALRKYCEIMDSEVLEIVVPPQGFYASPELTKDEWDWWIRQMPQIRIKFALGVGYGDDEWFAYPMEDVALPPSYEIGDTWEPEIIMNAVGICDHAFSGRDDGWELYGRKAVLRYADGSEQPMKLVEWIEDTEAKPAVMIGRASTIGTADINSAFWVGLGFCGEEAFVGFDPDAPKLVSYRIDMSYDHATSDLHLDWLNPGMEPIDIRYERDSDIGDAGSWVFSDDVFVTGFPSAEMSPPTDPDNNFADNDEWAANALADRIYLYDPEVATPMMEGISFVGDRVGMPPYNAEVLIDLHTKDTTPAWYAEETMVNDGYAVSEDSTAIDRALRTVVIAKAVRDVIAVSFEATKPLMDRDLMTSSEDTTFGEQRRTIL